MVERDRVQVTCNDAIHNAQNALCALTVARALELDVIRAAESLSHFAGVARRMSTVVDLPHIKMFDDYAHNPGKFLRVYQRSSLHTLVRSYGNFQPHSL